MKTITLIFLHVFLAVYTIAQKLPLEKQGQQTEWLRESYAIAKSAMQDQGKYELQIGEAVPATEFQLINGPSSRINTVELKGKYLLLSFWNTHCASCIEAFPKLERFQQQYADRLSILPVTFEVEHLVQRTLTKQAERGIPFGLPIAVRDSILRRYFPHQGEPYEVWIGPDGRLLAVTDGKAVTEEAIQKFINQGIPPANTGRYPFDSKRKIGISREEYLERKKKRSLN